MADIFISYSRRDSEQALALAERLRAERIEVWIDEKGIHGAEQWATEIVDGIKGCKTFVLLISESSIASDNVLKELTLALEKGKRILPVRIDHIVLPASFEYAIAGIQWVKISDVEKILHAHRHGIEKKLFKDDRKSLIILPLEDLSPDRDNGWFADGLTGELIDALSHIRSLHILDKRTSLSLRHSMLTTSELRDLYNTRYFIEGSVQKYGNQIKISISLLDAEKGDYLWQDTHRGEFDDIFGIQETVSQKVVAGLKLHLSDDEQKRMRQRGTNNPQAYEAFLKGQEQSYRHTKESLHRAVALFDQAAAIDPNFSTAHAAAAGALLNIWNWHEQKKEHIVNAQRKADLIKEISGESQNWLWLKSRMSYHEGDLINAERFARMVTERYHVGYDSLAMVLMKKNDHIGSANAWEEYVKSQPNASSYHNLLMALQRINDTPRAREKALEALPIIEQELRHNPDDAHSAQIYADMLWFSGDENSAREQALRVLNMQQIGENGLFNLACLFCDLNDHSHAIEALQKCVERGWAGFKGFFDLSKEFPSLVNYPNFQEIISKLKQRDSVAQEQ